VIKNHRRTSLNISNALKKNLRHSFRVSTSYQINPGHEEINNIDRRNQNPTNINHLERSLSNGHVYISPNNFDDRASLYTNLPFGQFSAIRY